MVRGRVRRVKKTDIWKEWEINTGKRKEGDKCKKVIQ
jgi:hypothetical protein